MAPGRRGAAGSTRREFLATCAAAALAPAVVWPRAQAAAGAAFRIGTTAVILDDQVGFLNEWKAYLQDRLERPVTFVQRGSYREITELLTRDELDFAWVCGYPYARNKAVMRLLAMPLYQGKPLYQSYLIVPESDRRTESFADLKEAIFAYSDPNSNSGYLVPQYEMLRRGLDPAALFRKSFFTYAHRKVAVAVANGVAQAGAIDGYVWETLALRAPKLTAKTRVARKSDEYGFPPLVARRSISAEAFARMEKTLVEMRDDPAGRALLGQLNLDGFARGDERVFAGIAQVVDYVAARQRLPA
jgi:phosphonate transport system substrate-binding protein